MCVHIHKQTLFTKMYIFNRVCEFFPQSKTHKTRMNIHRWHVSQIMRKMRRLMSLEHPYIRSAERLVVLGSPSSDLKILRRVMLNMRRIRTGVDGIQNIRGT